MHTKTELLELLRGHNLRLSKRLGQSYLIDQRLTERLVNACGLTRHDTVVEIGAGLGALTDLLASRAKRVVAVEVDRAVCEVLKHRMAGLKNVEVRCQDILTMDWSKYAGSKVVGAVPYHITSPILISLCEAERDIPEVWLGLQREVVQRLCAKPGTKAYGRLSLLVQYRFVVEERQRMSRHAFFPAPTVDSAWIRLAARPSADLSVHEEALLFEVVRAAFAQRRKTFANGLSQLASLGLDRAQAIELVHQVGFREDVRGENLGLEDFVRLAKTLGEQQRETTRMM